MVSTGMLWLIVAGGLSLPAFGQNAPRPPPIPSDPLEIVIGPIRVGSHARAPRQPPLQLLDRARNQLRACEVRATATISKSPLRSTPAVKPNMTAPGKWKMCSIPDKDSAGRREPRPHTRLPQISSTWDVLRGRDGEATFHSACRRRVPPCSTQFRLRERESRAGPNLHRYLQRNASYLRFALRSG